MQCHTETVYDSCSYDVHSLPCATRTLCNSRDIWEVINKL
jgi:hypothetical protein